MKYVIIGNSIAAIGCIEGIREKDKDGEITVVSSEKHHVYGRPLISYLLWGKTTLEKMKYRPNSFYDDNKVEVLLGVTALSIDKKNKKVLLDNGNKLAYDKLLIATGSRPFIPPCEGLDLVKDKHTFMTLDDALSLDEAINKTSNVLVIGAGLIGLKCVEGILEKVKSVTVVDMADRVLPSILTLEASTIVQNHLEEKGVKFILGDVVEKYNKNLAVLKSGKKVFFDTLVLAVGVRPNTQLIEEINGEVNRGIVIDSNSKTSIKDIYAAGDCAVSHDISCDQDRILAILPNAYLQGRSAGYSMVGYEEPFENSIPMNAIGFMGLHIVTAGSYIGDMDLVIKDDKNYKALFVKDNLLKGFIIIGDDSRCGIYTSLIRNKTPLDSVDYELIREKPQLVAMARKYRDEKLGGKK